MAGKDSLDSIYTTLMQKHPEGHALYKPVSATKLRPAILGYFDRNGDWKAVVDLADQNALRLGKWSELEMAAAETDTGDTTWGPKCSEHVRDINAGIKAAVDLPNAPVGGTIDAKFRSSKGQGAVLVTDPPVRYHQAGNEKIFIRWMSDNAIKLLTHLIHGEMVKEFGAWIVTKTYTTSRRGIAVLTSSESVVDVTLGVTSAGLGELTPSAGWWSRASASAWSIHTEPSGVVVFMSGVQFVPKFMSKTKLKALVEKSRQTKPTSRAGRFDKDNMPPITISALERDEEVYQLCPIIVGEITPSLEQELEEVGEVEFEGEGEEEEEEEPE